MMTPETEARVRAAAAELVDALVAAVDDADARDDEAQLLDAAQAAKVLGIARSTLYGELLSGRLRSRRIGRRRLIARADLTQYIDDLTDTRRAQRKKTRPSGLKG